MANGEERAELEADVGHRVGREGEQRQQEAVCLEEVARAARRRRRVEQQRAGAHVEQPQLARLAAAMCMILT